MKKIRTAEAARLLEMHPVFLLLYLAEVGATSFDDLWPELEESWIEAIRRAHWDRFGPQRQPGVGKPHATPASGVLAERGLGEHAGLVLEKLWRKKKYGAARVTVEALVNMVHLPSSAIAAALEELETRRLVLRQADQYSLDPSRTAEIERFAKARAETNSG